MRFRIYCIIPILLLAIFSYGQDKENSTSSKEGVENVEYQDELDYALADAIETAKKQATVIFSKSYKIASPNEITISINQDYFFSKDTPHLIIKRDDAGTHYVDILLKKGGEYESLLSHEEWILTHTNDTILDVNGDGYKDFVVNGYGASGCCLKAYSNVFLLRPKNMSFSEEYFFLNPTFSPEEGVVRGVCYGHPGETEMYKCKWIRGGLDRLEYVSYEKDKSSGEKTGYILITSPKNGEVVVTKWLKEVPSEYTNIFGYEWFTGDL